MSVLDHLTQIQTGWEIALIAGFVSIVLTFIVGMTLVYAIKSINTDKVFSSMTTIIVILAGEILFSIVGLLISSNQVSTTKYYPDKYNIEQMANDYNARIIEDDREHKPYLVHYEGYGTEEWVYYAGKPDPQAKYIIQDG